MATIIGDEIRDHLRTLDVAPQEVSVTISMANGAPSRVCEAYEFESIINSECITITALYLKGLSATMVIGMDLIIPLQLVTFSESLKYSIHEDSLPHSSSIKHINSLTTLNAAEAKQLKSFLDIELPKSSHLTGRTSLVEHTIKLKVDTPIKQRYYYRNPAMQVILNEEIDTMLADDVIEPSDSPWSSPVVLIKKPSGKYRVCIDFRKVNSLSEKDAYPLPQINHILEKLRDAHFISTIDLKNGYWQVPLAKESRPITAFTIPGRGLFQFKVMPFGLHSAPATFQRLLDIIIGPEFEPRAFAYLDDLVLVSKTFSEHMLLLKQVFKRLQDAGLQINPEKCQFCRTELKYLGHVINAQGVQTDPDKVKAIEKLSAPKTVKQVRSFLGVASWYRRFIPKFSLMTAPLTKLLKKNQRWEWTETQSSAFNAVKDALSSATALACPDFNKPFIVQVDASNIGLGASLTQRGEKKEIAIAFASRLLSESEQKFSTIEKECLALVWAIQKFRPYLEGYKFTAITDHQALRWLMSLKKPSGRLARWMLELQQHDFDIEYRKGSLNIVADTLSRSFNRPTKMEEIKTTHCNVINDKQPKQNEWYSKMFTSVSENPEAFVNYRIEDGKLFRKIKSKKADDILIQWKMCVPIEMRNDVFKETHDNPTAGHLGINKTINRIAERYFWPGWRQDTKEYVRKCESCQRYKVEQKPAIGKMNFRRPRGPWFCVTSDIIGPLPRSKKGNRFLLVFQDTFTKWIELTALKDATAKKVSQKFEELILYRYGAPEVVLTDNGTQYTSKIFAKLTKEWGITHQCTAPYSPQSNPTERANRVLKTMISQYVHADHRSWDIHLNELCLAINTATHDATKFSPAQLNFGRELKLPKSIYGPWFEERILSSDDSMEASHKSRLSKLSHLKEICKKNLENAFKNQAQRYNLRRRENNFLIGQQVLRRNHVLSSAADYVAKKLSPKFEGPYVITGKEGRNIFNISDQNKKLVGRAHAKDLKPYSC